MAEPTPAAPAEQLPIEPLNILVVDDYPANRLLLSRQLSYLGHCTLEAKDGKQGLELWRNHPFDVVITDCNMPIMNGYELAGAIRDEEQAKGLEACLILGFTANAQREEKVRCGEAGMDDCLFKPISLRDLSARLASRNPGATSIVPEEIKGQTSAEIDLSGLEQWVGADRTLINDLLRELASSNEKDLARLQDFYIDRDHDGLMELAHRIKGGARIVKAHRLILCCERLEAALGASDAAALTQAVAALQQSMERLTRYLGQH